MNTECISEFSEGQTARPDLFAVVCTGSNFAICKILQTYCNLVNGL